MTAVWHGRDWQEYCVKLLQIRYSANTPHGLQLVPDRHNGDLGIEAFSTGGVAYQCYAAEEPLDVRNLYERQRDKLTRDLLKLKSNQVELCKMFGDIEIKKYVFLVHRHESKALIIHATDKAKELVGWRLPFISSTFSITVETADDYSVERERIHAIPRPLFGDIEPTSKQVSDWRASNVDLRATALTKLKAIEHSESSRERVVEALTGQYLEAENALERIKVMLPELYTQVLTSKARRENLLVLEYPVESASTRAKLTEIARDFTQVLRSEFSVISEQDVNRPGFCAVFY